MTLEEREQKWILWIAVVSLIACLLIWFLGLVFIELLFGPYR